MTPWNTLSPEEQLALREAYGQQSQAEPGTCSLDLKIARFADWLAERGVAFEAADLKRPSKT